MKKVIILAILACVIAASAFAGEDFTVQTVKGRVEREQGNQKIALKAGDKVNSDTVIFTGVGASVVLVNKDGKTFTISAARSGKVADLTKAAAGIRIGGNVSKTDTEAVNRTTSQTTTASARASDQAGEDNIAAE